MSVIENLYKYNKDLKNNISENLYDSILSKAPYYEEESYYEYSDFHKLIDHGYLNFISINVSNNSKCLYKVCMTDKGIQSLKTINSLRVNC